MAKKQGRPRRSASEIRDIQARIAACALRLFREEGFDAVSIRRLAKEDGCAPMTIYAHFDSKNDILRYLWADVLADLFNGIRARLAQVKSPNERLLLAAQAFVDYWLENKDHFRLVFMSNDVSRSDVESFVKKDETLAHFAFFFDLMQAVLLADRDIRAKTDVLVSGLIGIALCINTIGDYPWADAQQMVGVLVAGVTGKGV